MKRSLVIMAIGLSLCGAIVFAGINPWASAWAMGCGLSNLALLWEVDRHERT